MASNLLSLINELKLHLPDSGGVLTSLATSETNGPDSGSFSRVVQLKAVDDAAVLTVGNNKVTFVVDSSLDGRQLSACDVAVATPATGSTLVTVQVRNNTKSVNMLSTAATIDAGEYTTYTAATKPVVSAVAGAAVVSTGDQIAVNVTAVGNTTPGKGLGVILTFS